MYATVGIFSMDPAASAQQARELSDRIIPMVRVRPEFVSGYWNQDRVTSRSYAYLVWQSEAAARSFAAMVEANASGRAAFGVHLESIAVVEVLASAVAL